MFERIESSQRASSFGSWLDRSPPELLSSTSSSSSSANSYTSMMVQPPNSREISGSTPAVFTPVASGSGEPSSRAMVMNFMKIRKESKFIAEAEALSPIDLRHSYVNMKLADWLNMYDKPTTGANDKGTQTEDVHVYQKLNFPRRSKRIMKKKQKAHNLCCACFCFNCTYCVSKVDD